MGHWTAMASSLRIWFTPHVKSCEWREGMKCALRGQLVSSLWDTFAVVSIVSGDLQAALCLLAPQNHIKHNELWIFEDQWNEQQKQADQLLSGGICRDAIISNALIIQFAFANIILYQFLLDSVGSFQSGGDSDSWSMTLWLF